METMSGTPIPVIAIAAEMDRSVGKYGAFPCDPMRAAAIVVEEACEALSEAMKITNPASRASHRGSVGTYDAMIRELTQTASAAILAINAMHKAKEDACRSIP